jgi:cellulose synthase operon protein YhjQ
MEVKRPVVVTLAPAATTAVTAPVLASTIPAPARSPSSDEAPASSLRDRLQAIARERRLAAEESNRRAQDKAMREQPAARVIAVVSAKGGVGKTTLVASLGKLLKRPAGRTLLLDLDPQNALLSHFGLPRTTSGLNQARLQATGWDSIRTSTDTGLECLPFGPSNAADLRAFDALLADNPHWLTQQLAALDLNKDDLLLIDTPTGASPWLHPVLAIADQVVAMTLADAASYLVLDKLQAWMAPLRPGHCAFLINQVDTRSALSLDMSAVLQQQLDGQWLAEVPFDPQVSEALAFEYDLFQQPVDGPACQALRGFANQLAQHLEQLREETSAS